MISIIILVTEVAYKFKNLKKDTLVGYTGNDLSQFPA